MTAAAILFALMTMGGGLAVLWLGRAVEALPLVGVGAVMSYFWLRHAQERGARLSARSRSGADAGLKVLKG